MITATEAAQQAGLEAQGYAYSSLRALVEMLDIDRGRKDWRDQLAPFASVWAAMITTAAQDYDSAVKSGVIAGTVQAGKVGLQEQQLYLCEAQVEKLEDA